MIINTERNAYYHEKICRKRADFHRRKDIDFLEDVNSLLVRYFSTRADLLHLYQNTKEHKKSIKIVLSNENLLGTRMVDVSAAIETIADMRLRDDLKECKERVDKYDMILDFLRDSPWQ